MSINLSRISLSQVIALCLTILSAACGRIDLDRPIAIDVAELQPDEPEAYRWVSKVAKSALTQAIEDMGGRIGGGGEVLHVTADYETKLDAYVDSNDRSTMHLGMRWILQYPDKDLHLRVLVIHEFGHMLGRDGHPPCNNDANATAQNCLPAQGKYSQGDVDWICGAAAGGVCGGRTIDR